MLTKTTNNQILRLISKRKDLLTHDPLSVRSALTNILILTILRRVHNSQCDRLIKLALIWPSTKTQRVLKLFGSNLFEF